MGIALQTPSTLRSLLCKQKQKTPSRKDAMLSRVSITLLAVLAMATFLSCAKADCADGQRCCKDKGEKR